MLAASVLFAGCVSTREAIVELDGTHEVPAAGDSVRYRETLEDRSWSTGILVGAAAAWQPLVEATAEESLKQLARPLQDAAVEAIRGAETDELEDPVERSLDHLSILLEESAGDLDPEEWAFAVVAAAKLARLDPTQVVRAQALRVLRHLARRVPREPIQQAPADRGALIRTAGPLVELAADSGARLPARERLVGAVRACGDLRPDDAATADALGRLALLAASRLEGVEGEDDLRVSLQALAARMGLQAAWLSAAAVLGDRTDEVQSEAVRYLIERDAIQASQLLKLRYSGSTLVSPMVRVVILQSLADSGVDPAKLDPAFRGHLLRELDFPDAALHFWSRVCMSRLLGMEFEAASHDNVRTRWLALGDWEAATGIREDG